MKGRIPSSALSCSMKAGRSDYTIHNVFGWLSGPPAMNLLSVATLLRSWWEQWLVNGSVTCVMPGQPTMTRAWITGCWVILKAFTHTVQINLPFKAAWQALEKKGRAEAIFGAIWAQKTGRGSGPVTWL